MQKCIGFQISEDFSTILLLLTSNLFQGIKRVRDLNPFNFVETGFMIHNMAYLNIPCTCLKRFFHSAVIQLNVL